MSPRSVLSRCRPTPTSRLARLHGISITAARSKVSFDYLPSQARKFRALKDAIDEGMADVEAGRVVPWDLEEFLKPAHEQRKR
jgi:hypothetical protein